MSPRPADALPHAKALATPASVWLVTVGEPLPIDPGTSRPPRVGILAQYLVARGSRVTWWTGA